MKTMIIATLLVLSGCASIDSAITKDANITSDELKAIDASCKGHKGVFEVRKAYVVMTGKYEWRVTCKDNSNFTVDPLAKSKE